MPLPPLGRHIRLDESQVRWHCFDLDVSDVNDLMREAEFTRPDLVQIGKITLPPARNA